MTNSLVERLLTCASESEMGRNFAGTPQACREAAEALSTQTGETGLVGWRDQVNDILSTAYDKVLNLEPAVAHMSSNRKIDRKDALGIISGLRTSLVALFATTPSPDPEQAPTRPSVEGDYRGNLARALFEAANGKNLIAWSDATRDFWLSRADQALAIPKASASDGSGAIDALIDMIISAYHTTRLSGVPAPEHIRSRLGNRLTDAIRAATPTARDQALEEAARDIDDAYTAADEEPCRCNIDENSCPHCNKWDRARRVTRETLAALQSQPSVIRTEGEEPKPIDMLLFCPKCGLKHVDERDHMWDNPPHRSHLCLGCGTIWRPSDVPTNGVAAISTAGKADTVALNLASTLSPTIAPPDPVARQMAEALRNMIALAEPHFTSAAETLALNESVNALSIFDGRAGR